MALSVFDFGEPAAQAFDLAGHSDAVKVANRCRDRQFAAGRTLLNEAEFGADSDLAVI
jgi:hypothetical protein